MRRTPALSAIVLVSALALVPSLAANAVTTSTTSNPRYPDIGVASTNAESDGPLVVSAWTADTDTARFVRYQLSTDSGATWSPVGTLTAAEEAPEDLDVSVSGDSIGLVWEDATTQAIRSAVSSDRGATWQGPSTVAPAGSSPEIAVSGSGATVAFSDGPDLVALASGDGGATWGSTATVAMPVAGHSISDIRVTRFASGSVVAWHDEGAPGTDSLLAASRADGATWGSAVPIDGPGVTDPSLFQDGSTVTAVYLVTDPLTSTGSVRVARSADAGATWSAVTVGTAANADSLRVARNGNRLAAAFFAEAVPGSPSVQVLQSADGGATWGPVRTAAPAEGVDLQELSVFPLDDGVFVSYNRDSGDYWDLQVTGSNDGGVTWAPRAGFQVQTDPAVPLLTGSGTRATLFWVNWTGMLNSLNFQFSEYTPPASAAGPGSSTPVGSTPELAATGAAPLPVLAVGTPLALLGLMLLLVARRRARKA